MENVDRENVMSKRIFLFGTKKCKFCDIQKKFLKRTFGNSEWLYLDLIENKDALDIAEDVNIDNIPAIIVLNENYNEVFRKEGLIGPDQLFSKIVDDNKILPISAPYIKQAKSKKIDKILLSYQPNLNDGDKIKISSFGKEIICESKVARVLKVSTDFIGKKYGGLEKQNYLNNGGREDWSWVVELDKKN